MCVKPEKTLAEVLRGTTPEYGKATFKASIEREVARLSKTAPKRKCWIFIMSANTVGPFGQWVMQLSGHVTDEIIKAYKYHKKYRNHQDDDFKNEGDEVVSHANSSAPKPKKSMNSYKPWLP